MKPPNLSSTFRTLKQIFSPFHPLQGTDIVVEKMDPLLELFLSRTPGEKVVDMCTSLGRYP